MRPFFDLVTLTLTFDRWPWPSGSTSRLSMSMSWPNLRAICQAIPEIWILVRSHTSIQTYRKWCIRAHRAYAQVGSKIWQKPNCPPMIRNRISRNAWPFKFRQMIWWNLNDHVLSCHSFNDGYIASPCCSTTIPSYTCCCSREAGSRYMSTASSYEVSLLVPARSEQREWLPFRSEEIPIYKVNESFLYNA